MTIGEFKAWLEGYEASFSLGYPMREQWEEIRRRLEMVGAPPHLHLTGEPHLWVRNAPGSP